MGNKNGKGRTGKKRGKKSPRKVSNSSKEASDTLLPLPEEASTIDTIENSDLSRVKGEKMAQTGEADLSGTQEQAESGLETVPETTKITETATETIPETTALSSFETIRESVPTIKSIRRPLSLDIQSNSSPSPPLAASTPTQTQHSASAPPLFGTASETSPLLDFPSSDLESGYPAHQKHRRVPQISLILVVLAAAALLAYVVFCIDFSEVVERGFSPNAESASVVSVNDKGVHVSVAATLATHYSEIPNLILRFFMHAAAAIAGTVFVAFADKCDIYVGAKGLEPVHVISASISGFPINLADKTISQIQFDTEATFHDHGIAALGDYLEHCDMPSPELEVTVRMDPVISKKWLRFTKWNEKMSQKFLFQMGELAKVSLNNLSLSLDEDELCLSVSASANHKLPFDYILPGLKFDLSIPDCDLKLRRLGVFNTSAVHIAPAIVPSTHVDMLVTEVSSELLQECSDGVSPFNKFMGSLANDDILRAYVSAQPQQDIPKWLLTFLERPHKVAIPIPMDVQFSKPKFPADMSFLEDLDLTISSRDDSLWGQVSTKAKILLDIPLKSSGFHADVSRVNYTMQIFGHKDEHIMIISGSEGELSFSVDKKFSYPSAVATFPNTAVEVKNAPELGRVVNGFLNGNVDYPSWVAHIREARLNSRLVKTKLKDLVLASKHFTQDMSNIKSTGRTIIDKFLANMETAVDSIVVTSTSKNEIKILVDFEISNCLNVSLAIPQRVGVELFYNGTVIGTAEFSELIMRDNGERQKLTASSSLHYESEPQRVLVEEFLSHVISGSNSTYIDVGGQPGSDPLAKTLQEIQVRGLKMPEIGYQEGTGAVEIVSHKRSSPFLLGATIHIWTSEIEVTILNPLSNMEINARIQSCIASYDGHMLAHIEHSEVVVVPPGVYKTPRIPIEISSGIGADILRRAMNGNLAVDVVAEIFVLVGEFPAEVVYNGSGLTAQIKI